MAAAGLWHATEGTQMKGRCAANREPAAGS
jgi:hypothetical protein